MSDRRLNEQALRLRPDPLITPLRTPVLLSDSKGLTLKEQVRINPVLNIELLWKKGATAEDRLGYLQENLSQNLIHLNQITLFVWIGTFNLTTKSDGFIELASTIYSNSAFELINILKQIYHFCTFGPSVKLVFLHLPLYSIYHYSKFHNHPDPDKISDQDFVLHQQINIVNDYINDTNRLLQVYKPRLSEDLLKSKRNSPFSTHPKYKYKSSAYSDGVHPNQALAKLWLARICRLVHDFCY